MEAKTYLEASQHAEIRVHGLRDGKTITLKQPELETLEGICKGRKPGIATFSHQCSFVAQKRIVVSDIELWFGDVKVADYLYPTICLLPLDVLTCTFSFTLSLEFKDDFWRFALSTGTGTS